MQFARREQNWMPGKARVHELAAELGVPAKDVLAKLKELGEFVKSASSTVDAPVARRLRECYRQRPAGQRPVVPRPAVSPPHAAVTGQRGVSSPSRRTPFAPLPSRRPRREWYRGEEPQGLTRFLLDNYVVKQRDPEQKPPSRPYWDDEVRRARKLSDEWAGTLLEGLEFSDILRWVRAGWSAEHAGVLHRAGIPPEELGWSYEDRGDYSLGVRLELGLWTTEQVMNEIERRRALG
jgi:hypothetical protein